MTDINVFKVAFLSKEWRVMWNYLYERSYGKEYHQIIVTAFQLGILDEIEIYSVLKGELKEEFQRVISSYEFPIHE